MGKISELPVASSLTGAELFPVVQGGVTRQATVADVAGNSLGMFNVQDYGAVGDTATDDTAAIQAAINAASATVGAGSEDSGTIVLFPHVPFYYKITGTLNIPNHGLTFRGLGRPGINGTFAGYMFERNTGSDAGTSVRFDSLTLINNHANGGCISIRDGAELNSVRDCTIRAGSFGLSIWNCFETLIENSQFIACGVFGISTSGHTQVLSCNFSGNFVGVELAGACCNVTGCRFEVNNTAIRIGQTYERGAFISTSTAVAGNTFEANDVAIVVQNSHSCSVTSSLIQGTSNSPSGGSLTGLLCDGSGLCHFENMFFGGAYERASVIITPNSNSVFTGIAAQNSGGSGILWDIQGAAGDCTFVRCNNPDVETLVYTDLMVNGDFSSSSVAGWFRGAQNTDSTLAVVSGQLVHTVGAADAGAFPRWLLPIRNVVSGETYRLTVGTMTPAGLFEQRVALTTDSTGLDNVYQLFGPGSIDMVALGQIIYVMVMAQGPAGGALSVDNITLFLVPQLTIASGAITVHRDYHTVDTEGAAATDNLDTINGGSNGDMVVLRPHSSGRAVVVRDGVGNIASAGDMILDNEKDTMRLIYDGPLARWLELSRSNNSSHEVSGEPGSYALAGTDATLPWTPVLNSMLLDAYPTAWVGYSFRKLRFAYAGSAIRLRRSNDNVEADIGFHLGGFNIAAAEAHLGGYTGYITKWYDQSGNGDDVVLPFPFDSQPLYVVAGIGGKPCLEFVSSDYLRTSAGAITFASSTTLSAFAVASLNSGAGTNGALISMPGDGQTADSTNPTSLVALMRNGSTQGVAGYHDNAAGSVATVTYDTANVIGSIWTGANHIIYKDAVAGTTVAATPNLANNIAVAIGGNWDLAGAFWKGQCSEVVIWPSNQTANVAGIDGHMGTYYGL